MQTLSIEELQQLCPRGDPETIAAVVAGAADLDRAGINTPLRLAHFLAQVCAESGGLSLARENTAWTPEQMCQLWPGRFKTRLDPRVLACRGDPEALANLAYSGRPELGNTGGDDGWAYRGGGLLQITGRGAYSEAGHAIGVDLEGSPELIEDPGISLAVALWYWGKHNCNQFADGNYGRAIGNAINRGNPYSAKEPIGYYARQKWLEKAWSIVGDGSLPDAKMLTLGAYGPRVSEVQTRLKELGYAVGDVDSVFGPTLARAVAAFKHDQPNVEMEPSSIVGPQTLAAMQNAQAISLNPERTGATVADLVAKGSTEAAAGVNGKRIGQLTLYGGIAGAAEQTGVLQQANGLMSQVGMLKVTMVPALEAIAFGLSHFWPTMLILGGVWYWTKGHKIINARLIAHQLGFNLSR
jgi:putative chitinase